MGNEKGKFFYHNGNEFGIVYDDFKKLIELSKNIQRVKQLKDYASVKFIKEELFNWVKSSFIKKDKVPFMEYLIKKLKDEIKKYEIWIPVPYTSIDKDIKSGKINFKTITENRINEWINKTKKKNMTKDEEKRIDDLKEKIKKDFQGYAAGIYEYEAEIERAQELAYFHFKKSLSVLRLFSGANFLPELISGAYEYGHEMLRTKKFFTISKDGDTFIQTCEVFDKGIYINIDENIIDMIKKGELVNYNELLKIDSPNKFQNKLLESLMIYSKHTIRYELYDKLLYILVALETILLKNSSEPIQQNLGERMAFIIGKNLEQRKEIIKNIKEIYTIRSKFIHHGQFNYESIEIIKKFMYNTWITFSNIVNYIDEFNSKEEFLNEVDNLKYS